MKALRIVAVLLALSLMIGELWRSWGVGRPVMFVLDDQLMKAAGVPHELVTFDNLDHYLDDSAARAGMLRKIDGFLAANGVR